MTHSTLKFSEIGCSERKHNAVASNALNVIHQLVLGFVDERHQARVASLNTRHALVAVVVDLLVHRDA